MLHAIGFPDEAMPQLLVHGWWNLGGAKMSKSAGNIVDPDALAEKYGAEALRYYLMSDMATGKDADFSEERLIERYNADLANSLGNLLNRSLNMAYRYREGKVIRGSGWQQQPIVPSRLTLGDLTPITNSFSQYLPSAALQSVWGIIWGCNQFVETSSPWTMAKDPTKNQQLDTVLYHFADVLRIIAILISPVLPKAAHGIFDQLNWKMELSGKEERFSLADAEWGGLPDGHVVGKPVPLFPRIET
jgi:methionyl-tRNA synthetase